jgi:hypothetical protein
MSGDDVEPGSVKNLHLVISDIEKAHTPLVNRGLAVSSIYDIGGVKYAYFQRSRW